MKANNIGKRIWAVGVLLITVPYLLRSLWSIPDFFKGFLIGIGICLAIGGLFLAKRRDI